MRYLEGKVKVLLEVVEGQSQEEEQRKKQHAKALGQRIVLNTLHGLRRLLQPLTRNTF